MKTDYQLAEAFFTALIKKGFNIKFNHESYGVFDQNEPHPIVIEIISSRGTPCVEFDFHSDGSFYRCSGFTEGYWQDEIDWSKY